MRPGTIGPTVAGLMALPSASYVLSMVYFLAIGRLAENAVGYVWVASLIVMPWMTAILAVWCVGRGLWRRHVPWWLWANTLFSGGCTLLAWWQVT